MKKPCKSQYWVGATVIGVTLLFMIANQAAAHQSTWQGQAPPQRHYWTAQHHHGPGPGHMEGWGHGTQYDRMYNPNTLETIRGTVVSTNTFTPMNGMSPGVHLMVRVSEETLSVHLGPSWYIDDQDLQVSPDDEIEVIGSWINFADGPAIVATEIRHGNQSLTLRDSEGIPAWSGWRRQGGRWRPCCWELE